MRAYAVAYEAYAVACEAYAVAYEVRKSLRMRTHLGRRDAQGEGGGLMRERREALEEYEHSRI